MRERGFKLKSHDKHVNHKNTLYRETYAPVNAANNDYKGVTLVEMDRLQTPEGNKRFVRIHFNDPAPGRRPSEMDNFLRTMDRLFREHGVDQNAIKTTESNSEDAEFAMLIPYDGDNDVFHKIVLDHLRGKFWDVEE
jgi:hypothetical protein